MDGAGYSDYSARAMIYGHTEPYVGQDGMEQRGALPHEALPLSRVYEAQSARGAQLSGEAPLSRVMRAQGIQSSGGHDETPYSRVTGAQADERGFPVSRGSGGGR